MSKLVIIDGNSLANRAFYGVPLLSNKDGVFTNAVYGFLNMLLSVIEQENPDELAVAFDISRKVFRHEHFEDYKANRKGMPEELRGQMPLIKEALGYMDIPAIGVEGYEGDDIIGTVVRWSEEQGNENVIVSGDRDTFQLISDKTVVLFPKKGLSQTERMDVALLAETQQLRPEQIIDLKGLMGDSSDNIPGVPGIGDKTARKLLAKYESIENVYEHLDDFSGKKMGEKLAENKEIAFMSKKLATIHRDVPLDFEALDLKIRPWDKESLLDFYDRLGLHNLAKRLQSDVEPDVVIKGEMLKTLSDLENTFNEVDSPHLSVLFRTLEKKQVLYFAFDNGDSYGYEIHEDLLQVLSMIGDYCKYQKATLIAENLKEIVGYYYETSAKMPTTQWDFTLADYLLNPEDRQHDLIKGARTYLNKNIGEEDYFAAVTALSYLAPIMAKEIKERSLLNLYQNIEMPLAHILVGMEKTGIAVNKPYLEELQVELGKRLEEIEAKIYEYSGEAFNINSPKQLGEVLFEKMGLPVIKKTKTGYSTNAEVLDALLDQHAIIQEILDYRQLAKLKSTYVDGLLQIISPDQRIHTTFNQTITATGRLSSTEPNLQNIPVRTSEGKRIRKAFIPLEPEHVLLSADYSQIELRILAHMSYDDALVTSFNQNEDIHRRTASEVFHVPIEEVTPEMRRTAKAVNFGIIYGQTDYGLSKELGISRKEAKTYIDSYFEHYADVRRFIDDTIAQARRDGYVKTMFDRRRIIRDINSKNRNLRNFAERTAVNTPIQGTAADIIKLAMIECQKRLRSEGFQSKMLLQVHDELIFDVPPKEIGFLVKSIRSAMTSVVDLRVPMKVDMKVGFNWDEMESV